MASTRVHLRATVAAMTSVSPGAGPTVGGTAITITGTNLTGTSSVTIGGAAATSVTVVNATTVTAVTPVGAAGARDVVITTPGGTATAAGAFSYVTVPSWATMLEALPDPAVVTDATLRNSIVATGLAWRVRATTSFIEMVLIPPGTFSMGCSTSDQWDCRASEGPIHLVTLTNAFYIGRYEVTQTQWSVRMGSNPSYFQPPNTESLLANRPVESVSRPAVDTFLTATGLRLPTEAEWEYAYRAGTTTGYHSMPGFPSGTNDNNQASTIAWFSSNANGETHPVGEKAANALGLHDMSGNVEERVNDWYSSTYYASSPSTNPPGPATGSFRAARGGSWLDGVDFLRSHDRSFRDDAPSYRSGFRVARTP